VALGPDGTLWALHRGGAVWGNSTFDFAERMRQPRLIDVDVVVKMDADTGWFCWGGEGWWCRGGRRRCGGTKGGWKALGVNEGTI